MDPITLPIPEAWIDAIAAMVKEKLVADLAGSPWMTRQQAALYLSVPIARLEKDRTVPAHRWSGRVMYHRGELDDFLLERSR